MDDMVSYIIDQERYQSLARMIRNFADRIERGDLGEVQHLSVLLDDFIAREGIRDDD
jgi:hypothetical protein